MIPKGVGACSTFSSERELLEREPEYAPPVASKTAVISRYSPAASSAATGQELVPAVSVKEQSAVPPAEVKVTVP